MAGNADLNRSLAHELAVSIDVERLFGFDLRRRHLVVFHLLKAEMPAKIDHGKHAEQLEFIHSADDTNIQLAVVELRLRRDLHAPAISRRVCECCKNGWLKAGGGSVATVNFHRKRSKPQKLTGPKTAIPPVHADPLANRLCHPAPFRINS